MAEDLTRYLENASLRVKYLHSDIDTLERATIIRDLRLDTFDILVGINLLREGLDIPEINLVAILDADKEGFLRSEISLIQTVGRAARNADAKVIMYADTITKSMKACIDETERRRKLQKEYNEIHNITPKSIKKSVRDLITIETSALDVKNEIEKDYESMNQNELNKVKTELTKLMNEASVELNFEEAMIYRDRIKEIDKYLK